MAIRLRRNCCRVRDCRLPCLDTISRRLSAGSGRGSAFWFAAKDARRSGSIASAAFGETLADAAFTVASTKAADIRSPDRYRSLSAPQALPNSLAISADHGTASHDQLHEQTLDNADMDQTICLAALTIIINRAIALPQGLNEPLFGQERNQKRYQSTRLSHNRRGQPALRLP